MYIVDYIQMYQSPDFSNLLANTKWFLKQNNSTPAQAFKLFEHNLDYNKVELLTHSSLSMNTAEISKRHHV